LGIILGFVIVLSGIPSSTMCLWTRQLYLPNGL